jgi:antitoxin ParD1/3/4
LAPLQREGDVMNEWNSENQSHESDTGTRIETIRAKLIEGEKSGFTDKTVEEIWEEARKRRRAANS